jgi:hypothetical protein
VDDKTCTNKKKGSNMAQSIEKKGDKPKYETPVVVNLDKVDKAAGLGHECLTGSLPADCVAGNLATGDCFAGGAPTLPID